MGHCTALLVVLLVVFQVRCGNTAPSSTTDTPHHQKTWRLINQYILTVVASLSALGSIIIIITYFLWTDLQTTSRKILVYISIGDFFTVYPTLVIYWDGSYNSNTISCELQSFVTSTAVMWSFFWTSSLAIYLYIALVKKNYELAEKLMVIFHFINWTVPVVLLGMAWHQKALGYADDKSTKGWCWITWNSTSLSQEHSIMWMLFCGKFWEIISYFVNAIFYFLVTKNIKLQVSQSYHLMSTQSIQIAETGVKKLVFVPVIFVLLRIWGTIRFFLLIFGVDVRWEVDEVLGTLQIIGDQSQGIVNFILFCALTEKFKRGLGRICRCNEISSDREPLLSNRQAHHGRDGRTFSDSNLD